MQEKQIKNDKLGNIYKELINIVNGYPDRSPNDVLRNIEFAPSYSMEKFGINTAMDMLKLFLGYVQMPALRSMEKRVLYLGQTPKEIINGIRYCLPLKI